MSPTREKLFTQNTSSQPNHLTNLRLPTNLHPPIKLSLLTNRSLPINLPINQSLPTGQSLPIKLNLLTSQSLPISQSLSISQSLPTSQSLSTEPSLPIKLSLPTPKSSQNTDLDRAMKRNPNIPQKSLLILDPSSHRPNSPHILDRLPLANLLMLSQ